MSSAECDISKHATVRRVGRAIERAISSETSRVTIGAVVRRRECGKITVENARRLDVTALSRDLPAGSRIIVRDADGVASRIDVCFPLTSSWGNAAAMFFFASSACALAYVLAV